MLPFLRTRVRAFQAVALPAALALFVAGVGCGDVYRPVATPVLQPGGDPSAVRYAFSVNQGSGGLGTVTVVDVSGDTNLGNSSVGKMPVHGALQSISARLFVANQGDDTVSAISTSSLIVPAIITMPAGSKPSFVATVGSTSVYVSTPGTVPPSVSVVDPISSIFVKSIAVGNNPGALAVTPDLNRVYVLNQDDGTVSVIVAGGNTVSQTLTVGARPVWAVVSPDASTAWVVNQGSNSVSVINVPNGQVTSTIPVGIAPRFAAYDSRLKRLYVANAGSDSVTVIDTTTEAVLRTVPVGPAPVSLAVLGDGSRIYVANSGCSDVVALAGCSGDSVSVVDANSFAVRKTITVGSTPVCIVSPSSDPSKVIVANRDSNNISSIRTSDDTVVNTIASGSPRPVWLAVTQ